VSPTRLQSTIPRDLETICLKCLRKVPSERYASAAALADDLERYLEAPVLAGIPRVLGTFHVDSTYDLTGSRILLPRAAVAGDLVPVVQGGARERGGRCVAVTGLFGAKSRRREDPRLVRGQATYTGDRVLPGWVYA